LGEAAEACRWSAFALSLSKGFGETILARIESEDWRRERDSNPNSAFLSVVDGARLLALRVRASGSYRRRVVHGSHLHSSGFSPGRGDMLETAAGLPFSAWNRPHDAQSFRPSACSQASTWPKASCCHCSGLRSPILRDAPFEGMLFGFVRSPTRT